MNLRKTYKRQTKKDIFTIKSIYGVLFDGRYVRWLENKIKEGTKEILDEVIEKRITERCIRRKQQ